MSREATTFEIVRGRPQPDELAAVVAVLATRRQTVAVTNERRVGPFDGGGPASWSSWPLPGWRTIG
ncbi:acyl-CoA carboxylase subunit epsilon [Amycolatopsis sp. TRM77291]